MLDVNLIQMVQGHSYKLSDVKQNKNNFPLRNQNKSFDNGRKIIDNNKWKKKCLTMVDVFVVPMQNEANFRNT